MARKLVVALFVLLWPQFSSGTVPELPGNGIDDGSSSGTFGSCGAGLANAFANAAGTLDTGCDLLSDAPDQDRDGYTSDGTLGTAGTTYTDCDDTDRTVYPGVYKWTGGTHGAPTGYKLCQTNGSYGSNVLNATTPLCESPNGTTHCFYVDFTTGNDTANNCQTFATPCKTLAKLSGGSGGGSLPASPITLAADDFVYYMSGTNTTSFTMTVGGVANINILFSPGASGTSGHPITLKQYPGYTGTQSLADGLPIWLAGMDYITIDGIIGASAQVTLNHSGSFISGNGANDMTVQNVFVTSGSLSGTNNGACIKSEHANRTNWHHNFLKDCIHNGAGLLENVGGMTWLDDENAGEGADHNSHHNVIWYSSYSNTVNGNCWFGKHGANGADVGSNGHQVKYSYCISPRRIVFWSGSGLRFKGNFAYNDGGGYVTTTSVQGGLWLDDGGTGANHEANYVQYNTFINSEAIKWKCPIFTGSPLLTVDHNVFVDNDGTYDTTNDEGIVSIAPYFSDAHKTAMDAGLLVMNNNIYYNGSATLNFGYFNESAAGACGDTAGAAGGNYSFTNWKGTVGQDTSGSFVEDPTHNSQYECASANCSPSTKGWLAATETAASGPSIAQLQAVQKKKKKW